MTRIKQIIKADARYKEGMRELERLKTLEDPEEREKAIKKASKLIVGVAYNRAEVYELIGYTLLCAADRLFRTSAEMLETVQDNVKYNDRFKLNDAKSKLNKIIETFETEGRKIQEDYHLHGYVEDSDLVPYDAIENNSEVILHFCCLIYNALKKSKGNAKILQKSLTKLKGEGEDIFTLEEIELL